MGYKDKGWKVRGQRGEERQRKSERERKRDRERQCERSKRESRESENRVKETAETSPDASLHTLSGSITHANPRGKQHTHTHSAKKDNNFNSMAAHQQI